MLKIIFLRPSLQNQIAKIDRLTFDFYGTFQLPEDNVRVLWNLPPFQLWKQIASEPNFKVHVSEGAVPAGKMQESCWVVWPAIQGCWLMTRSVSPPTEANQTTTLTHWPLVDCRVYHTLSPRWPPNVDCFNKVIDLRETIILFKPYQVFFGAFILKT